MSSAENRLSPRRLLWRRIEELKLPLRPLNVLHGAGIVTLADLVRRSEAELLALKNFGRKDVILLRGKLGAARPSVQHGAFPAAPVGSPAAAGEKFLEAGDPWVERHR